MSHSIFHGLALTHDAARVEIHYPVAIHPRAEASAAAARNGIDFDGGNGETWCVRHRSADRSPRALKTFFADLNAFPPPCDTGSAHPSDEPLVSCIVVVNENHLFVREQLLPALWAHSVGTPIEVILVHNGPHPDLPVEGVRQISSAWGAVSCGYNAGARAARGEYLAFFHDDCIVDDADWIARAFASLGRGADAVTPEYRTLVRIGGIEVPPLPVAKAVPLVLRRETFDATGGVDEFHYVGYEDLDFTLALLRAGKKLARCGMRVRHFSGMSSTLKYAPVPGLDALFAMAAVPARAIRARFGEFAARGYPVQGVDVLRLALDVQILYVLKKYRDWLRTLHGDAYEHCRANLERSIASRSPVDATLILPRFRALDRAVWGAAAT